MSRNIRQKYPAAAAKAQKRRRLSESSSSIDLSDDEGYSAVEDISDSEDNDEEDVIAVEEETILLEGLPITPPAPRPLSDDEEEEDDADEEDADEEEEEEDDDGDEHLDEDADNASWAGILSDVEDGQAADLYHDSNSFVSDPIIERHVRFDVPDSDSDSTETEDDHADLFPDIFVSQNSLDPAFRKEIEYDTDESSGSNSFWDYHGHYEEEEEEGGDDSESEAEEVVRQLSDDENVAAVPTPDAANATETFTPTFEESLELDGYESDGDTTDEEDIPEPVIRKKARRLSTALSDEASDSEADSPVKTERGQPRVGRFKLDRSDKKPIAVLNPLTRKMMIFTPHRRRHLDLSPEQFNFPWTIEEQTTPLLSNSANMMLSAMFSSNTFGDFVNAQAMGPAEAFFPFPTETNGDDSSTSPSTDGEDEDEEKLDINDFITFGEAADDESSGDEVNNDKWGASPKRPATASGDMGALSHLNSDTVGAFRRNQINQQLILSNQATQDSLAFSGPYNYTAIRGLKSDRFDTAAVPLTPIRRHKKQINESTRGESTSTKRKALGEAGGSNHKRHRSISDVNFLRI